MGSQGVPAVFIRDFKNSNSKRYSCLHLLVDVKAASSDGQFVGYGAILWK